MKNIFISIAKFFEDNINPTIRSNEEVSEEETNEVVKNIAMGNPRLYFGDYDTEEDLGELKELREVKL